MTSAVTSHALDEAERSTAIAQLFISHHSNLLKFAARSGAESDAEDIVSEAFCQLYKNWERLRSPEAAVGYLRSTIRNLTRMRIRKLLTARRYTELHREESMDSAEHQAIEQRDQRATVRALRKLPTRQYQALVLRHWMDLKEAEIAKIMGISTGAVKSHTSRGMAKLSELLDTPA